MSFGGAETRYSWSAWSYGDIALVDTKDALLACDAARRTCEKLLAAGTPLMPTKLNRPRKGGRSFT